MTQVPDNNGNDFIRGLETRACVNGMTKSDVERLKNALVKKILDDETVIDVTEDGSVIANANGLFLSINGQLLGLSVDGENVIPVTEPYLPEDENENPLAPPNDTIMTSANIAVDPRIVHTFGNETIDGIKTYKKQITGISGIRLADTSGIANNGQYKIIIKIDKSKLVGVRTHTLFYFMSRQRERPFDFIVLYTNYSTIMNITMNLRANQDGYTYILSQDDNYGYISILCNGTTQDAVQAGVVFSTEPNFNTDAFIISTAIASDTVVGNEIMRLTP